MGPQVRDGVVAAGGEDELVGSGCRRRGRRVSGITTDPSEHDIGRRSIRGSAVRGRQRGVEGDPVVARQGRSVEWTGSSKPPTTTYARTSHPGGNARCTCDVIVRAPDFCIQKAPGDPSLCRLHGDIQAEATVRVCAKEPSVDPWAMRCRSCPGGQSVNTGACHSAGIPRVRAQ
jgi:hypothetical protein